MTYKTAQTCLDEKGHLLNNLLCGGNVRQSTGGSQQGQCKHACTGILLAAVITHLHAEIVMPISRALQAHAKTEISKNISSGT